MTAYAQAVHDLTEGRESVATRKVRFTARVAMLRGAKPEDCKRRLIRNGVPESLASRIVAEEFAKAELDLEHRHNGWRFRFTRWLLSFGENCGVRTLACRVGAPADARSLAPLHRDVSR
jgi:hypothetical protein